jgi:GTP cyclohydrolase II
VPTTGPSSSTPRFLAGCWATLHRGVLHGRAVGDLGRGLRIHSECFTGDVLGSERCDCGPQLLEAVRRIAQVGGTVAELLPTAVQPRTQAEAHTRLDLPCDDLLDAEV